MILQLLSNQNNCTVDVSCILTHFNFIRIHFIIRFLMMSHVNLNEQYCVSLLHEESLPFQMSTPAVYLLTTSVFEEIAVSIFGV